MGMFDDLKETRDERKKLKTEHLVALAKDSINNGTYRFFYGYNSGEDLQEVEEVLSDINKELKQYKFVIKIASKFNASIKVSLKGKDFGVFSYTVEFNVDAL